MRTTRLLTVSYSIHGGSGQPPWMQTPVDADCPPPDADHTLPWMQTPWSCDLWCMLGSQPPPPVNRMTDRCKNITLPQTSFASGN